MYTINKKTLIDYISVNSNKGDNVIIHDAIIMKQNPLLSYVKNIDKKDSLLVTVYWNNVHGQISSHLLNFSYSQYKKYEQENRRNKLNKLKLCIKEK